MKTTWRDGARVREVELRAIGPGRWRVRVDDAEFELASETMPDGKLRLATDGRVTVAEVTPAGPRRFVRLGVLDFVLERESGGSRRGSAAQGGGLEAMKMEHLIRAPRAGRVRRVEASPGQMVQAGVALVELEEPAPGA